MIKAALLDFDGTLVRENILAIVCEIVGKKEESLRIDNEFHKGNSSGLQPLIDMINLLIGVSVTQIQQKLKEIPEEEYLMPGTHEFIEFLHKHKIISILASGNIMSILQYFQKSLNLDYVIGSRPKIENDIILGISEEDFTHQDYKLYESQIILESLKIKPEETVAIGDSTGDKSRFDFAGTSIAINPKEEIEKYADYVIQDDLSKAIPIIEKSLNYA